jgi:aspartate racemase
MNHRILGIIGGLGPLASSEFVKTIYERNMGDCEQLLPAIILYSDPSFPDRTDALMNGRSQELFDQLTNTLSKFTRLEVSEIVICCLTIHHLFPDLPVELRRKVLSLVDVILWETMNKRRRQLLLCTRGTRNLRVFQSHAWWDRAREFIVLPDDPDQEAIHHLIYRVKKGEPAAALMPILDSLISKYKVGSFIAGCTELHLFSKQVAGIANNPRSYCFIDPLIAIAENMSDLGVFRSL